MRRGVASRQITVWSLTCLAWGAPARQTFPSLDGVGHDRGNLTAPVEVAEFLDFGCPECARFAAEVLPGLTVEFLETDRVRWKAVPFVLGSFRHSRAAAEAAECAADQGGFWPMHDRLLTGRREWSETRRPAPVFVGYAIALGLDTVRFSLCVRGDEVGSRVREHDKLARAYRVRGTPTFYLNRSRRVEGALPLAQFHAILLDHAPTK